MHPQEHKDSCLDLEKASMPSTGLITDSRSQVSTSSEAIVASDTLNADAKISLDKVNPVVAIQNNSGDQDIGQGRGAPKPNSATLLILTISTECLDKGDFTTYASVIKQAAATATRRLYVYLIHPILACPPEQRARNWVKVQTLSTFVYSTSVFTSPSSDITVLYDGWSGIDQLSLENWKFIFANSEDEARRLLGSVAAVQIIKEEKDDVLPDDNGQFRAKSDPAEIHKDAAIPVVTVNGTFDHLHHGHKNHLALAAWLASESLVCSISPDDSSLLERKKYSSVLQNYSIRIAAVESFLRKVKAPGLNVTDLTIKCVPKLTKWGAQVSDANIQATVLSVESVYLKPKLMAARVEAGHSEIEVFTVDVVTGSGRTVNNSETANAEKLSSSAIRKNLLERSLTFVLVNGHAGAGKHSIAMALSSLIPKSRVIDNHLLADLADALCSRSSPQYALLRREIRRVVLDHITTSNEAVTTYIFTSNFSTSSLGTEAAIHFQESAANAKARFVPINIVCSREEIMRRVATPARHNYSRKKLTDPDAAAGLSDRKVMFGFDTAEDKLSLDVSSLTASEAAARIFRHIEELT